MTNRSGALVGAVLVAATVAVLVPSKVDAQRDAPRPVLGGHRFAWNPFTESPFPQTYVRNVTGGGKITGLEFVPEFDLGDGTIVPAVQGDLLFAELEFEYMHRVQPWLAVWGRLGGLGRVGTSTGSLLAQGVNAIVGYELGWLFRIHDTESFVLSGITALSRDEVTDVNLLRWVQGVVGDTDEPLVSSGPRLRTRGGLRGAWGLDERWGIQFRSELGYGEATVQAEEDSWIWDHALSLSYDLARTTSVPLGFVLSGATRSAPREGGSPDVRSKDIGLRSAFTARDNFLVALDTSWNGLRLPNGDHANLFRGGLSLQLYF